LEGALKMHPGSNFTVPIKYAIASEFILQASADFDPRCRKNILAGLHPEPLRTSQHIPQTLAGLKGSLFAPGEERWKQGAVGAQHVSSN